MSEISGAIRLKHGTTKSILSKLPETSEESRITKLQNDVSKLSSTLGTINKKINDQEISTTMPSNSSIPENNTNIPPRRGYAEALLRPIQNQQDVNKTTTPLEPTTLKSLRDHPSSTPAKTIPSSIEQATLAIQNANKNKENNGKLYQKAKSNNTITTSLPSTSTPNTNDIPNRYFKHAITKSKEVEVAEPNSKEAKNNRPEQHNGFTAVRRKKVMSYHISNIDIDVTTNDIYNYMDEGKVKCTHIRVYYGNSVASARVNIHESDIDIVENCDFWPEGIICRKWQSR